MRKCLFVTVMSLALTGYGEWVVAQPTPSKGESTIKVEVPPLPAPTSPATMNFDNLSESVAKTVQKRLDESRRDAESQQHNRKKLVRAAVYGVVAVLLLGVTFFKKRKSALRKK